MKRDAYPRVPPERMEALRLLWPNDELSTSEIGKRLGISKNAVAGMVNRSDLPRRKSPIRPLSGEPYKPKSRKPQREPNPLPDLSKIDRPARAPAPKPVFTAPVRQEPMIVFKPRSGVQCEWLDGSAAPYRQCEATSEPGKSWCAKHLRRVFVQRRETDHDRYAAD